MKLLTVTCISLSLQACECIIITFCLVMVIMWPFIKFVICKISDTHHCGVDGVFTLFSCHIAYVDVCLLMFWDSLSVPGSSSRLFLEERHDVLS
jgi:hypothetical protein